MSTENLGTALVTGASTGIGARYAQRLAERGYDVILVARNRQRMNALASRLTNETGRNFEVLEADLVVPADLRMVEEILRTDSSITMLVNNAGVGAITPLVDSDVDDMESMIDINITALVRLTMAAVPAFLKRGAGTIVQVGSVVGIKAEWLNGVYSASKAFVLAYAQSLRNELSAKGIRIQAVLPATTRTEFWDRAGKASDSLADATTMTPDDVVRAALVGLDQGEFVTIPALEDASLYQAYDDARNAMAPGFANGKPASRFAIPD
ncbi:SDR family oxidoreductase [Dyella sp.]|uniref:SDR family NAD(P)-dependent oxidoreductase n=1 Tax=Dyella sp. TaxID=1869338 RepID=UPI002ED4F421